MATKKRLIYMDDAIDKLRAYADRKHAAGHNDLANGILKAVSYIRNNMVRVDAVEVVHGRWVPLEYDGFADGYPVWDLWECSECGEEHSGDEDTLTPYCPNCGAKMDGGAGSDLTGSN